ncbi:hypothetical protein LLE87_30935, partial [Paenibacillus polymyxa]|nr:hypothetical protein [Paenibacillus polymyxa]
MAAIQSQLDSRIITMASFLLKSTTSVLALAFAPAVFAQSATPAATAPAGQPQVTLNQIVEQTLLSNPEIQAKYHDFQASLEGQAVA